jgi:hypothetical protein
LTEAGLELFSKAMEGLLGAMNKRKAAAAK